MTSSLGSILARGAQLPENLVTSSHQVPIYANLTETEYITCKQLKSTLIIVTSAARSSWSLSGTRDCKISVQRSEEIEA